MKPQEFQKYATLDSLVEHYREAGLVSGTKTQMRQAVVSKIPKESVFQKAILDYLQNELPQEYPGIRVKAFKLQAGPYMQGGLPDVWAVVRNHDWELGVLFCFEVKRPLVGRPSDLQRQALVDLGRAGAVTAIVSYVSEVRKIIHATIDGVDREKGVDSNG